MMKQRFYPDRRFDVERPVWIGILFVFIPPMSYYVAPYLVASRHVALPAPAIAAIVVLYILGVFFHLISDAQKFYTLRAKPSPITDGLYSRLRNPNYLGEIMIYCAYALLSTHWLPFLIVALWSAFFYIPGACTKETNRCLAIQTTRPIARAAGPSSP